MTIIDDRWVYEQSKTGVSYSDGQYRFGIQYGWRCPMCGRIFSLWMPFCVCSPQGVEYSDRTTVTTTSGSKCSAKMGGDADEID